MKNIKLLALAMWLALGFNISTVNAAVYEADGDTSTIAIDPVGAGVYSAIFNSADAGSDGSDAFDTIYFNLANNFDVTVFASDLSRGFSLLRTDLLLNNSLDFPFINGVDGSGPYSFLTNLDAGKYQVNFKYSLNSQGSYTGGISVAAVPEPETYAMLLAGLGLIGFAARRRKTQA